MFVLPLVCSYQRVSAKPPYVYGVMSHKYNKTNPGFVNYIKNTTLDGGAGHFHRVFVEITWQLIKYDHKRDNFSRFNF